MTTVADITTETLWRQFHADLLRFVARRVSNPADAEDVVQRVFLQVHRALPTLRDSDRLQAWMYQTTRRAIIDFYRSAPHRREVPAGGTAELEESLPAQVMRGDESSALTELASCLTPLIAGLPDQDQEALSLVEFQDLTQSEAARRLGVSLSGMKSRIQRARRRLREVVDACCRVEFDRRGGVMAYERRAARAQPCGCRASASCQTAPDPDRRERAQ